MNRYGMAFFTLLIACCSAFSTAAFTQSSGAKPPAKAAASKAPAAKPAEAKSSAAVAEGLPTTEQVDASLKRTLGYDPALTWTILDIRASAIPGLADVTLSIAKQAPQHIYISTQTQNAVIGEMIPFGANPFAPSREKLKAADGPSLGPPKTPAMEIVEFSDLECPHCKTAAPIVEKLATDFPQVRITFQQFPLPASIHPWAMKAALYADCAGHADKAAFWKYIDSIFENQGGIALATADDKLKELATTAGLDAAKLSACAESKDTAARVEKSMALGNALEVTSTPTVFINGRKVNAIGSIPYEQLKLLVQFEIDHAGK
jgi:protein-disulfide isomerase